MAETRILLDFQSNFIDKNIAPGVLVRTYSTLADEPSVGDAVYQKTDGKVGQASAVGENTMPCIGIVEQKDFPVVGECVVRYDGDTTTVVGLSTGGIYIVSKAPGQLLLESNTGDANYPDDPDNVQQQVGIAAAAGVLFVRIALFRLQLESP